MLLSASSYQKVTKRYAYTRKIHHEPAALRIILARLYLPSLPSYERTSKPSTYQHNSTKT